MYSLAACRLSIPAEADAPVREFAKAMRIGASLLEARTAYPSAMSRNAMTVAAPKRADAVRDLMALKWPDFS
jgi:hypothetical protein